LTDVPFPASAPAPNRRLAADAGSSLAHRRRPDCRLTRPGVTPIRNRQRLGRWPTQFPPGRPRRSQRHHFGAGPRVQRLVGSRRSRVARRAKNTVVPKVAPVAAMRSTGQPMQAPFWSSRSLSQYRWSRKRRPKNTAGVNTNGSIHAARSDRSFARPQLLLVRVARVTGPR
jgi:hypothetical protein